MEYRTGYERALFSRNFLPAIWDNVLQSISDQLRNILRTLEANYPSRQQAFYNQRLRRFDPSEEDMVVRVVKKRGGQSGSGGSDLDNLIARVMKERTTL